jgi:hypothetical protein
MAAGRGGLVATARNDLVNFGFQEAGKIPGLFFQGLEKRGVHFPNLGKNGRRVSNPWKQRGNYFAGGGRATAPR